jgi:preprotein translocase subunit YajC
MFNLLLDAGAGLAGVVQFLPFILILVVFYFFMIRPQQKRQKEEQALRDSLKKGDNVITIGGAYGKVVAVDDKTVTVQLDVSVKVKFEKAAIRTIVPDVNSVTAA